MASTSTTERRVPFTWPAGRWSPVAVLALAVLLPVVVACGAGGRADASPAEPLVVRRGDLARQVLLSGELVAEEAVVLTAPNVNVWPVVVRWLAEDGSEVRAGERLVEFDNSQLTSNLEELRTRVVEQRNRVESEAARLAGEVAEASFAVEEKRALRDKARLDAALPEGLHAGMELARRRLTLSRAELELDEAEGHLTATRSAGEAGLAVLSVALRKAETELRSAEAGVERMQLLAPRDGVFVVARNSWEDRTFQTGDSTSPGSPVARLPDLSTMVVHARLFDVDDARVAAGQAAMAVLDAFPEQRFAGRVREVDGVAQETGGGSTRRAFRVVADLEAVDVERMRPGMSVRLVVVPPPIEDVLLAPRVAIDFATDPPRARRADGGWTTLTVGECNAWLCVVEGDLAAGEALALAAG